MTQFGRPYRILSKGYKPTCVLCDERLRTNVVLLVVGGGPCVERRWPTDGPCRRRGRRRDLCRGDMRGPRRGQKGWSVGELRNSSRVMNRPLLALLANRCKLSQTRMSGGTI